MRTQNVKVEEIRKEEIELGRRLVETLEMNLNEAVDSFRDSFKDKFEEIVKQKLEGKEIKISAEENKNVAKDLIEQLKQSIELMKEKKVKKVV